MHKGYDNQYDYYLSLEMYCRWLFFSYENLSNKLITFYPLYRVKNMTFVRIYFRF